MQQRDEFQTKLHELSKSVRSLQVDKRCLEEHCAELSQHVNELTHSDGVKKSKDHINNNRKPFISTVRSGSYFPSVLRDTDSESGRQLSCWRCCSSAPRGKIAQIEAEREKNYAKDMLDLAEMYQKQVSDRHRSSRTHSYVASSRISIDLLLWFLSL